MSWVLTQKENALTLQFTRREVAILCNALNEALEALDDWEVEPRMGCAKEEAQRLLDELGRTDTSDGGTRFDA